MTFEKEACLSLLVLFVASLNRTAFVLFEYIPYGA